MGALVAVVLTLLVFAVVDLLYGAATYLRRRS